MYLFNVIPLPDFTIYLGVFTYNTDHTLLFYFLFY